MENLMNILTFEGIDYASWQTAYAPQGVTFFGGRLVQNLGNHYIEGATSMVFNPSLSISKVTFLGDAAGLDNMLLSYIDERFFEPTLFESMSYSPLTPTGRIPGWTPGMMWEGRVFTEGLVNRIDFIGMIALDDIAFDTPAASAVPEPSSLALVLVATLTLLWSRRYVRIPSQA
jgi:hypothetical protein